MFVPSGAIHSLFVENDLAVTVADMMDSLQLPEDFPWRRSGSSLIAYLQMREFPPRARFRRFRGLHPLPPTPCVPFLFHRCWGRWGNGGQPSDSHEKNVHLLVVFWLSAFPMLLIHCWAAGLKRWGAKWTPMSWMAQRGDGTPPQLDAVSNGTTILLCD